MHKSNLKEFDLETLKKQLSEEDDFILSLIDTIPPKFYFDQEVQEKIAAEKHANMDKVAEDIKKSFPKLQPLTAKNKHKRARLDPNQHKSVSQIQELMIKEEPKVKKRLVSPSVALTRAANIQELQQRLQEKIVELKGKRRGCSEEEFQEKRRLKRKMDKVRRQKGNLNKPALNGKVNTPTVPKKPEPSIEKAKPVYNKDGKIIYSKFDFAEPGEKTFTKKDKKKKLKQLIHDAEKSKERIESVKQTDPSKANELVQKNAWQRAIQKAEGVKLKDDPSLLKKTLKKQEKQKHRSSSEWKKRQDHTEKMKKARQDKRQKNIQGRKKEKLEKKIKRAKKKGRLIPGF